MATTTRQIWRYHTLATRQKWRMRQKWQHDKIGRSNPAATYRTKNPDGRKTKKVLKIFCYCKR
ncbi:hypothetical protein ACUN16_26970 [Bacillus cereus group sp. Bce003]|uniref:hypothetical protein n=1 Tax=Bacillus cereus group sp. Bce003 TaxID=3445258 RepID=UPI004041AC32